MIKQRRSFHGVTRSQDAAGEDRFLAQVRVRGAPHMSKMFKHQDEAIAWKRAMEIDVKQKHGIVTQSVRSQTGYWPYWRGFQKVAAEHHQAISELLEAARDVVLFSNKEGGVPARKLGALKAQIRAYEIAAYGFDV